MRFNESRWMQVWGLVCAVKAFFRIGEYSGLDEA